MINSVGNCILSWFDLVWVLYLCFWVVLLLGDVVVLALDLVFVCDLMLLWFVVIWLWVGCDGHFRGWLFCLSLLCFALGLFVSAGSGCCGVGLTLILVGLGVVGCLCEVSACFIVWSCAFGLFALFAVVYV